MITELRPNLIALEDLPLQLRLVSAVVGLQATLLLVRNYGGVRLYVPVRMTPDHVLSRLLGFDLALKLSAEFGGMDHFDIPRAAGAVRVVRNRQIAEKFIKGKSLRLLALEYQLTERAIQKILAGSDTSQEDRQAALF
jgi:hypothetical protein